jgi:hypothetical protein
MLHAEAPDWVMTFLKLSFFPAAATGVTDMRRYMNEAR